MADDFKTAKEDIAKKQVLAVETANVKIKKMIVKGVEEGIPKEKLSKAIEDVMFEVGEELADFPQLHNIYIDSIKASTNRWYRYYTENQKTLTMLTLKELASVGIKVPEISVAYGGVDKFRPYVANNKKGLAVIDKYERKVKAQLKQLTLDNPTSAITDKNGKVRRMSLRNEAENRVRLQANEETLQEQLEKGNEFVMITSHADCSPRCEIWQGKLYSLNNTSGYLDGKRYVPLEEAMAGENKDGNGILTGYNCRHRAVPYQKGMTLPTDYSASEIKRERKIDSKQRYLERSIRNQKVQEELLRSQGFNEDADNLKRLWQRKTKQYEIYSHRNNRAYYPWRTEIESDEIEQIINTDQLIVSMK